MKKHKQESVSKCAIREGFWYTDKQVAGWLEIGRSTVWAWVKQGVLPAPHKIGPKSSRFSGADLLNYRKEIAA